LSSRNPFSGFKRLAVLAPRVSVFYLKDLAAQTTANAESQPCKKRMLQRSNRPKKQVSIL